MNDPIGPREIGLEATESEWHGALRGLYEQLDQEVARLGPICQLSGRCCRFAEYGHTLFVSAAEVQFLLRASPKPHRPLDRGETCPWQDSQGRCTARAARPLGCRVYYCDASYQSAAFEISERYITQLKRLTENHGLPWNYAPLHRHLHHERGRGGLAIELAESGSRGILT
jgi:hypothetical protein